MLLRLVCRCVQQIVIGSLHVLERASGLCSWFTLHGRQSVVSPKDT